MHSLLHRSTRSAAVCGRALRSRHSTNFVARAAAKMAIAEDVDVKQTYSKLCEKLKDLAALQGVDSLLGWDEMVMMPPGAATARGAQKAALAGVLYDKQTDAELGKLLSELLSNQQGLNEWEAANVRDAYRDYKKATAIPKDLAQRMARHGTEAYAAWVEARKASDFSKFAPALQTWVDLSKEKAACLNPDAPAYDVLLDNYERGMTSERLKTIFAEVREGLVPLVAAIQKHSAELDDEWLKGSYNTDTQAKLCKQVAEDLGFSMETGRLDVSVHPFTSGFHPTDVRITSRYKEDNLTEGLTGTVHETGHALYEQGRNLEQDGLPVSAALSMGIHESQSLLWERMVALSPAFAKYILPKLAALFPEKFGGSVTPDDLYRALNVVRPSLIRVEADEATYPMHIIVRYELESGLIDGSIKVEDLPKLWKEKMQAYLGVVPPNDAQGVLQDIHWSMGALGYFPTYTLGAMYACQIYNAARDAIPGLEEQLASGDFKALKAWLNAKVHRVGSLHPSGDELMKTISGSPLDPQVFLAYLRTKYTQLYKLSL